MEIIGFVTNNAPAFLFVLIRTASILFIAPIFGAFNVPMRVKASLSLVVALLIAPLYPGAGMPDGLAPLVIGVARELLIGSAIGLCARFIFTGIEFAGQVASFQMGLGLASAYDPQQGQITVVGKMMSLLMILVFLSVNGHLMVMLALKKSFDAIPPYSLELTPAFMEGLVAFSKEIFVLGVKFAAPVVAILIFMNVALGVMSRTVPQLNMFAVGFVLTISVGFIMLLMSLPAFEEASIAAFERMWDGIFGLIEVMHNA